MSDSDLQPPIRNEVDANPAQASPDSDYVKPSTPPPQITEISPTRKDMGEIHTCKPGQTPWWKVLFEIAALVAVIAYTVAAFKQLGVMKGQLSEMQRVTRESAKASYAACVSAQVSRETLIEVQNGAEDAHNSTAAAIYQAMAATRSESAVVKLGYGKLIFQPYLRSIFDIVNLGNTDARLVKFKIRAVFLPRNSDPDFSYPSGQFVHGDAPLLHKEVTSGEDNITKHSVYVRNPDGSPYVATSADEIAYRNGEKDILVYGTVSYKDFVGVSHWSKACYIHGMVKTGLQASPIHLKCVEYNQSDTNQIVNAQPFDFRKIQIPPPIDCPKSSEVVMR